MSVVRKRKHLTQTIAVQISQSLCIEIVEDWWQGEPWGSHSNLLGMEIQFPSRNANFLSWSAAESHLLSVKFTQYYTRSSISSSNCTLLYASSRSSACSNLAAFAPIDFSCSVPWFRRSIFLLSRSRTSFLATIRPISFPLVFCIVRIRYPFCLSGLEIGLRQLCDQSSGTCPVAKLYSYSLKSSLFSCHLLTGFWCLSIWLRQDQELNPESASVNSSSVIRSSFETASVNVLFSPFSLNFNPLLVKPINYKFLFLELTFLNQAYVFWLCAPQHTTSNIKINELLSYLTTIIQPFTKILIRSDMPCIKICTHTVLLHRLQENSFGVCFFAYLLG